MKRARLVRIGVAPWIGGLLLLGACNALTGLSDDYHLEADGGGITPVPETGTPDTSTPDTAVPPDVVVPDVVVPDATTICDGGVDAAGIEVCEDFETDDAGASYYKADAAGFVDASMITIPNAGYADTRGLVVSVLRNAGGTSHVWAGYTLQAEATPDKYVHYDVSFRVKVLTYTAGLQYVTLGLLTFIADGAGNGDWGPALYPGIIRRNNNPGGDGVATKTDWHHVLITFDKIGTTPMFRRSLFVDDMTKPISTNDTYSPPTSGPSEVRIGAFYTGPEAGEVRVAFDQLVVHRNKP